MVSQRPATPIATAILDIQATEALRREAEHTPILVPKLPIATLAPPLATSELIETPPQNAGCLPHSGCVIS